MSIPFVKAFDFEYGIAQQLSPLVARVICNNPGPFTFTGSGTYLVGADTLAIIDPGPENEAHLQALLSAIDERTVSHILITHTHRDHCGGARALRDATDAPILAWGDHPSIPGDAPPALDEGGDFDFAADDYLTDGAQIMGDGWQLEALHTPGHISNHLCYELAAEKALFTGDHIMGWATTVVAPPDGNMEEYMTSLDLLLARDNEIYYPTHGAPVTEPEQFVRAVKDHRLARDRQILASVQSGHEALMDIVADVYAEVDKSLHIAAALNVKAHLDRHVREGTVKVRGGAMLDLRYQPA
ncbi:MBL fold metallo-hydrolase [Parvularcula flava]|uniref:MBL fold metallo-hydrolase n=1 Tax=Aquisalinus luteolus TaxID=1566827 RepID=A0A8J3ERL2_9PROT|nr:MBL fold metallo-hydrolase [Aquisalinus luteolus]NHK28900.1 MBL fold metallo-hydrolase [Aquisalinus luteolus]GGH99855.1 MBL fold metallo-hydrolase [Aquisalinus luteolus]